MARRRHIVRRAAVIALSVALAAVIVLSFVPALSTGLQYSFETFLDPSADANTVDRLERAQLGLETFAKYPLGDVLWRPGNLYYYVDLGEAFFQPHNWIVQLLVQEGIVGFGIWFTLLTLLLGIAFKNARRDHPSAVLAAYVVFYLGFCLFNANFYLTNNILLLVAPLGLILRRDLVLFGQTNLGEIAPARATSGGYRNRLSRQPRRPTR